MRYANVKRLHPTKKTVQDAPDTLFDVQAVLLAVTLVCTATSTQSPSKSVPITIDNFVRAESDRYFGNALKDAGDLGKFGHHRELMPVERRVVVRPNRDTFYSAAVVDLDAGPVTITLPDAGKRYRAMEVINEDQYVV